MTRFSSLLVLGFLASCSALPSNHLALEHYAEPGLDAISPATTHAAPEFERTLAAAPAFVAPVTPLAEDLHGNRFTIKAGTYSADEDALDDGFIINGSWMRYFTKILALEFELGYLDADGSDGGVDGEVWGIPAMVNARANVPIWILDVYGGLGVGGIYYDVEVGPIEDDGFVLGGNAFLGATINLADRLALGLEGKYYATEDLDGIDESLDAFALFLTLGFSR